MRLPISVAVALLIACGSRPATDPDGGRGGGITGRVLFGPVSGSTIDVFRITPTGERLGRVTAASADEDGFFAVELGASEGPFLLVAHRGTYADPATGMLIPLEDNELTAIIPEFTSGTRVDGLLITPISHLVSALAPRWIGPSVSLADAVGDARTHLQNHFGAVDWTRTVPADLTVSNPPPAAAATIAGLLVAGLSEQANTISKRAGRPNAISGLRLLEALHDDLAWDAYFDGVARQQLVLPEDVPVRSTEPTGTALDGDTLRFSLAQGIQAFLSGPRNASALRPSDVQPLLDALSRASDNRLFRTGGTGGFDNQPPLVTFVVKYSHPGSSTLLEPVGAARLVTGELTVTAEAVDPSGVEYVSVSVDGSPLRVAAQGNTPSRFTGYWTTSAAGPLVLTAHGVDRRGNSGDTSYAVRVDADAPVVTTTSPLASAYYAGEVLIQAIATDAEGLASFAPTGSSAGIIDTNDALAGIFARWTPPGPDGPVAINLTACDLVGHCTLDLLLVNVDRTPPDVYFAPVPSYTNEPSLRLRVTAIDAGAGVRSVWVRRGATLVEATATATVGEYLATVPLQAGRNDFAVWAVDAAGNSGELRGFPHYQSGTTLLDSAAPIVTNIPAQGNGYRPEATLRLTSAAVPPQLEGFPAPRWPELDRPGALVKASTRLDWQGVIFSAVELENTNASNTPYLTFQAAFDPAAESPLDSATYQVSCSDCSTTAPTSATGSLLPTTSTDDPRFVRWDLPLNAVTVPFLARLNGPSAALAITVTVTDRAGNSGSISGSMTFHVVAPPLWWSQEEVFSDDPQGVFAYRRLNAKYGQLFDPANGAFDPSGGQARVLRFTIKNPFPQPAAVSVTTPAEATWSFIEHEANAASGPGTQETPSRTYWSTSACVSTSPPPCGNAQWIARAFYGSSTSERCQTAGESNFLAPSNPVAGATTGWEIRGFLDSNSTGDEQVVAPGSSVNGTTFLRVPAATASTPGHLTLYVVVPRVRNGRPPLSWNSASLRFEYPYGQYYSYTSTRRESCPDFGFTDFQTWDRHGWVRYLTAVSFVASGSFSIMTQGLANDGLAYPPLGAPSTYASGTYSVDRSLD